MAAYESAGKDNNWITPKYIFDALDEPFDLDVAAPPEGPKYVPARFWLSEIDDGRTAPWIIPETDRPFVWMNPPFATQAQKLVWLTRFFEHRHGIALVPDRTSAPWFQHFAPQADAILWVAPKIKFEKPDGSLGKSPGTGTALLACGIRAADALIRARSLGFVTATLRVQEVEDPGAEEEAA